VTKRPLYGLTLYRRKPKISQAASYFILLALPVVDQNLILLGIITIDDGVDVFEEEATEDIQRLGGTEPLNQPSLSSGIFTVARKRVGWLMLLFVTESLTGTVLRHFEDELQTVVALAFFVPLLIGTGGNAGS
jgi:magnesium transporter